jgi:hypothetical protein
VTLLCGTLVRLEVALVAIERPDGMLVERLLDAGLRVVALHPNRVAAARARFRAAGGKSDRFDALVLCELARTDHHRFGILEPHTDQTQALRALTRARGDLVAARTGVMNRLRAELERFWPGPLRLCSHIDAEILLAFLERYPSPADADGSGSRGCRRSWCGSGARAGSVRPRRWRSSAVRLAAASGRRARRAPTARADLRGDDPHAQRAAQRPRTRHPHPNR